MFTKTRPREKAFVPGTSRDHESSVTFQITVKRDELEMLEMGARIKELRQSHGYKQQWIADKIGVQLRTYQFWQAGTSVPEQEHLEKLAALFNVTPTYILKGPTPDLDYGQTQIDRIEGKLDRILLVLGAATEKEAQQVREALAPLEAAAASKQRTAPGRSENPPAGRRPRRA